jgi:hypothetical protein
MPVFRPTAGLAMLAPLSLLAVTGCSSAGAPPCAYCDAGKTDLRLDRAEDFPAAEAEQDVAGAPADGAGGEVWHPATRDTPPGEAPRLTPLPDGGCVLDNEFETGEAPGWEVLGAPDSGVYPGEWSVILGDSGTVYSQGLLDTDAWHISYASAAIGPDQIIEAKLRPVDFYATDPSFVVALFGRYDPKSDSGYFVALRGDGSAIVRKRDHGKNASWGGGVSAGIRAGAWHTVRLEILGNAINAFLDGTPIYSVTDDSPLAGGGVALGSFGASLEVERIVAAEP